MNPGVILVAAGEGRRFGEPKAFVQLDGRPLVVHAAAAFEAFARSILNFSPTFSFL